MSNSVFEPTSIPKQTDRVFFITGGTSGLGAQAITLIASASPAHIVFSGRNTKKAEEVIKTVTTKYPGTNLTYLECDHSSLASVRSCAEQFLAKFDRLDVFMANAGIMAFDPMVSKDGYEIQFATNHLAHALLMKLLLPTMEETAAEPNSDVRIINMSSTAYASPPTGGIAFDTLKSSQASLKPFYQPGKWTRYGQSKLANLLYAKPLAKHYPKITSVSIHPGYIRTDLFQNTTIMDRAMITVMLAKGVWTPLEEGCWNQTWAATTPKENLENGAYYEPLGEKVKPSAKVARDDELAEKLWVWTEETLKEY